MVNAETKCLVKMSSMSNCECSVVGESPTCIPPVPRLRELCCGRVGGKNVKADRWGEEQGAWNTDFQTQYGCFAPRVTEQTNTAPRESESQCE